MKGEGEMLLALSRKDAAGTGPKARSAWVLINCALTVLLLAASGTCLSASTLGLADARGCPGAIARVAVHLALDAGVQADGLTFRLQVSANGGSSPLASPLDFEAGDVAAPSFKNSDATYLRVAWLRIDPALTGTTLIGNLLVLIPAAAEPGNSYTVHIADVQANNGLNPVSVNAGLDGTLVVTCCQAEDCDDGDPCMTDSCDAATGQCVHTPGAAVEVGIARFGVPAKAEVGERAELDVLIENSGCSDASVQCTVRRGRRVVGTKRLTIREGQVSRVTFPYKYSRGDAPRVCFTATVLAAGDVNPTNNQATGCTNVR